MNKSEKFNFDFEDGEDIRPELEKESEKIEKNTEKELNKVAKTVDEINKDEYEKPKFQDGNEKKVKYVTEKIKLKESDLVEAPIPGDLATAYRKARNYHRTGDFDLNRAEYTEITPEEAYKNIKAGNAKDIRLLIDGKLVTLRDNGYGDLENRNKYVDPKKGFTKKNGDLLRDTAHLPIKHMLSVADKIYLTNENTPEGKKDPNLMAARAQNIESPNNSYNSYWKDDPRPQLDKYDLPGMNKRRGEPSNPARYSTNSYGGYYIDEYKRSIDKLRALKKGLQSGDLSQEEYDREVEYVKDSYSYRRGLADYNNYIDSKARARYYDAEMALQKPFRTFKDLKNQLSEKDREINKAQDKLDRIKNSGSDKTTIYKNRLADYESQLDSIMSQIAALKMRLRYADEDDAEALQKATDELNEITSKYANAQQEYDKLMRKIPSNESYQPWGAAIDIYKKISDAQLTEELNDLVDSLYPQGLTESRLNDLLSYKNEMILEMLDLEAENEK